MKIQLKNFFLYSLIYLTLAIILNTQASAEKNDLNNINQDKLFIVEEPFSDKIKNYYQFQPLSLNSSGHKDILLKYESYLAIVSAIKKYQQIKLLGGWPTISKDIELKIGNRSEQIVNLRKRLLITGDIKANIGIEDVFDVFVEDGIKQFQYRHGLDSNGKLNMDTINALNQTVDSKLSQLGANKIRLLNNLSNIDEAYVLVISLLTIYQLFKMVRLFLKAKLL